MVTIKYDDLSAAFDFVSFAAPFEHRALLSLDTGEIYWISETYARFTELLVEEGCLDKWYAFEAAHAERALRDWCAANEIHLVKNGTQQSA